MKSKKFLSGTVQNHMFFGLGKTIIRYSQTTWWITGFNPNYKYLDATAAELFVKYTIRFKDTSLYHNFKRDWGKKWRCDDKLFSASYSF